MLSRFYYNYLLALSKRDFTSALGMYRELYKMIVKQKSDYPSFEYIDIAYDDMLRTIEIEEFIDTQEEEKMASTENKEHWILKNSVRDYRRDYRKYIHIKGYTPDGVYAIETDGHKVKKSLLKKYYRIYAITFSNPFTVVHFD